MESRYHPLIEGLKVNEDGSQITYMGRVLEPKKINRTARPTDTLLVHFMNQTFSVARLVCECWHGTAPDRDHDAIRLDPSLGYHYKNLHWGKRGFNPNYHKIKFPRAKSSKIKESEIPGVVERLKNGETLKSIAKDFGTTEMSISRIRKRYLNND